MLYIAPLIEKHLQYLLRWQYVSHKHWTTDPGSSAASSAGLPLFHKGDGGCESGLLEIDTMPIRQTHTHTHRYMVYTNLNISQDILFLRDNNYAWIWQWRGNEAGQNRVEVWIPTSVYFLLSTPHLDPQGSSHCAEAEGEGGWQTEAASAPAG